MFALYLIAGFGIGWFASWKYRNKLEQKFLAMQARRP